MKTMVKMAVGYEVLVVINNPAVDMMRSQMTIKIGGDYNEIARRVWVEECLLSHGFMQMLVLNRCRAIY